MPPLKNIREVIKERMKSMAALKKGFSFRCSEECHLQSEMFLQDIIKYAKIYRLTKTDCLCALMKYIVDSTSISAKDVANYIKRCVKNGVEFR